MRNQLIKEKQDLTHLSWSIYRSSSGAAGSFLKAYSELGGKKIYYKLSNFDQVNGMIGHECVNELIVDRLMTILGIPHLEYQLIHADVLVDGKIHDVYLCASTFKRKKVPFFAQKGKKRCFLVGVSLKDLAKPSKINGLQAASKVLLS